MLRVISTAPITSSAIHLVDVRKDSPQALAGQQGSQVDELGYGCYAECLAKLFRNNKDDLLPAAVGIYAPWGSGKVRLTATPFGFLHEDSYIVVGECCCVPRVYREQNAAGPKIRKWGFEEGRRHILSEGGGRCVSRWGEVGYSYPRAEPPRLIPMQTNFDKSDF